MHGWAKLKKIETGIEIMVFLKTVQPKSFSKLIGADCNFKNYAQETYYFVCLGSLILSFTCNFFAYFKFHSD